MLWYTNGLMFWFGVLASWVSVIVALVAGVTAAWPIAAFGLLAAGVAWFIGGFGPSFEIPKSSPGQWDDGDAAGVREPRRPLPTGSLTGAEID